MFRSVLYILFLTTAFSQDFRFKYFGLNDGLADVYIYDIFEDHAGILWIGTQDGLNSFDGSVFNTYRYEPNNPKSLSDLYVFKILEDQHRNIWVATSKGLNKFDRKTRTFSRYYASEKLENTISHNVIRSLYEDTTRNKLWIGSLGGLDVFDLKTEEFHHVWPKESYDAQLNIGVKATIRLNDSTVIFGTDGVGLFQEEKGRVRPIFPNLSKVKVTDIKKVGRELWVATRSRGLYRLHESNIKSHHTFGITSDENTVNSILVTDSLVYLATHTGIGVFSRSQNLFRQYKANSKNSYPLKTNFVMDIYNSKNGLLFVGTQKGLHVHDTKAHKFYRYTGSALGNGEYSVRSIIEDEKKNLWVATEHNGLEKFKMMPDNSLRRVFFAGSDQLSSTEIKHVFRDSRNNIWVATANGLNLFNPKTERFRYFFADKESENSLTHSFIWNITEDKKERLWIGTYEGLTSFDLNTKKFKKYKLSNNDPDIEDVRTTFVDSKGYLWLGTWNGAYKVNLENFSKVRYGTDQTGTFELSHDVIFSIAEDDSGRMWIGTSGGGVNVLDISKSKNTVYHLGNGLPNNVAHATLFADDGTVWVSTNRGISRIDHKTKQVRTFRESDGLHGKQFTFNSYHQGVSGFMYFGGVSGFTYFKPKGIVDVHSFPQLYFTDFEVFNKSILASIGSSEYSLSRATHGYSNVQLEPNTHSFSISYRAIEFRSPQNIQYRYKLRGFDSNWVEAKEKQTAPYTNISSGEYVFEVQSTNSVGDWVDNNTRIGVTIEKAWWELWVVQLLFLFLFLSLVYGFYRFRISQLKKLNVLRQKISADLHDSLAANLNSIALYGEALGNKKLVENDRESIQKDLTRIANESVDAVKDIIWANNSKQESLKDLVKRFVQNLKTLTRAKDIRLLLRIEDLEQAPDKLLDVEDKHDLWFLLKEVVNNSLKHSNTKSFEFIFRIDSGNIFFHLNDYGVGFNVENIKLGNGLTNIQKRAHRLKGDLAIVSDEGKGCQIQITLMKEKLR